MNFRRSDQKSVDAFLLQITGIVEENMSDEHFGAEALARKAGLSRSAIHRRLMILTRKSATRFIREIRLDKAMEMMQHTNDTAAEIAYKTGFGSPAYFHHCFHQYFGCTPLEARKLSSSAFRDPLLLKSGSKRHSKNMVARFYLLSCSIQSYVIRNRMILVISLIVFIYALIYILYISAH